MFYRVFSKLIIEKHCDIRAHKWCQFCNQATFSVNGGAQVYVLHFDWTVGLQRHHPPPILCYGNPPYQHTNALPI